MRTGGLSVQARDCHSHPAAWPALPARFFLLSPASPAGPRSSLVKASLGYWRWRPDSHHPDFENRLPFSTLFRPRCGLSHYYLRVLPGKEGEKSRADPNKLERKKSKGCPRRQEGDLLILYFFRSNCARSLSSLFPLPPLPLSFPL